MNLITGLLETSKQEFNFIVGENARCTIYLYFAQTQRSWYFDWKYDNIESKGNKMVLSPNILKQFENRIPFGLSVISDDLIPPFKLDDFVSRIKLFVLDENEVAQVNEDYFTAND